MSVDEPPSGSRYGGAAAGPVFSQIMGGTMRALNVQPDSPIRQLMVSDKVQESEPWAATQ